MRFLALCAGLLANTIVAQGVRSEDAEKHQPAPCYMVCKNVCTIRQDKPDGAGHTDFFGPRPTWRSFLGYHPLAMIDRLRELQSNGTCPPATRPNAEQCVIKFYLIGDVGEYQIQVGSRQRYRAVHKDMRLSEAQNYIKAMITAGQCSPALPDSETSAYGWSW